MLVPEARSQLEPAPLSAPAEKAVKKQKEQCSHVAKFVQIITFGFCTPDYYAHLPDAFIVPGSNNCQYLLWSGLIPAAASLLIGWPAQVGLN